MSLVHCPECGHEVSANAVACPNCGRPITTSAPVIERKVRAFGAVGDAAGLHDVTEQAQVDEVETHA